MIIEFTEGFVSKAGCRNFSSHVRSTLNPFFVLKSQIKRKIFIPEMLTLRNVYGEVQEAARNSQRKHNTLQIRRRRFEGHSKMSSTDVKSSV